MAYARSRAAAASDAGNSLAATLIAYDLQAGVYSADALADMALQEKWCAQIADLIRPYLPQQGSVLEVGVGEATTLAGVLQGLGKKSGRAYGFDVSWSRVNEGRHWLSKEHQEADLFVGDMFRIPLGDDSIDVVYSSHSLEPNGGREEAAIAECLRVARRAVVLVEPIFELASAEAQARMLAHGYVRGLRDAGVRLGAQVTNYGLLEVCHNPLNRSGVVMLEKRGSAADGREKGSATGIWRCPMTGAELLAQSDCYMAPSVGIAYPVLRGIPLLRPEHAVIASRLSME